MGLHVSIAGNYSEFQRLLGSSVATYAILGEEPIRPQLHLVKKAMFETPRTTSTEQPTAEASPSKFLWYRDWILLLTVPVVLSIDQLSKFLVRANLRLGESWPSEGLFRLTHGTNTGSAFGLFPNQTLILIVASVFAIGFLVYFYRSHALPRPLLRFAIALQLGGALGNLIDRLNAGAVVDFIDVGKWPIFNLADSSIVIGLVLLCWVLLARDSKPSSPGGHEPGSPGGDGSVGR